MIILTALLRLPIKRMVDKWLLGVEAQSRLVPLGAR